MHEVMNSLCGEGYGQTILVPQAAREHLSDIVLQSLEIIIISVMLHATSKGFGVLRFPH